MRHYETLRIITVTQDSKHRKKLLWSSIMLVIKTYHFIIKKIAEELKGQSECLGKNTEKKKLLGANTKTKRKEQGSKIYDQVVVKSSR